VCAGRVRRWGDPPVSRKVNDRLHNTHPAHTSPSAEKSERGAGHQMERVAGEGGRPPVREEAQS